MGKRCIGKLDNIKIGKLVDELGVAQEIPNLRPQSGPCMLEEHPDKSTLPDHSSGFAFANIGRLSAESVLNF